MPDFKIPTLVLTSAAFQTKPIQDFLQQWMQQADQQYEPDTSGELADSLRDAGYLKAAEKLEGQLGRDTGIWPMNAGIDWVEKKPSDPSRVYKVSFDLGVIQGA
jgi:hypothetical protein